MQGCRHNRYEERSTTGMKREGANMTSIDIDIEGIEAVSQRFEDATAQEIIRWTVDHYDHNVALACSFQDCVIIDLAVSVDPDLEVIFLDTGYHFPETLEFVDQVRERYNLNLIITSPGENATEWPCGSEHCCEYRKVEPLGKALKGRAAWLTALKRSDSPVRAHTPIVSWDATRGMVKVNPLANWTDDDISSYITSTGLPEHPLISQGYLSIGCAPTTRPVAPGEHPRAGRWSDTDKTECGLHT